METKLEDRTNAKVNGIDVDAVGGLVAKVKGDPSEGIAGFRAATHWKGGFQSETEVNGWSLGGRELPHAFTIRIDEPRELCGQDAHANPQEHLLAAANACMLNTFVAVCSLQGVEIESLTFESEGELDLRGFLGIDEEVPAGYEGLRYTIRVRGNGTRAQFEKAHQAMIATSPNYYNLRNAVPLESKLVIE